MEQIFHPVSGEKGYFATESEKILIDAVLCDYTVKNQLVTHSSASGVKHE